MTTAGPGTGIDRLNALITPDLRREVDQANQAALVGWGRTLHVVHLVRAIRTLHAAGQCHATVPLLRSVTEYALGTIWLADASQGAVDVLNRRLQASKRKLHADLEYESITLADLEAVRTFMDILAAQLPPHPDERLSVFRHLLLEYGLGKMMPFYDILSGRTHLSLESVQQFYQDRDGTYCLSDEPRRNELSAARGEDRAGASLLPGT